MLHPIDAAIVLAWLILTLLLGLWFSRQAGTSVEAYFVSDRSLPWWVVGTSMVATTFAADTPLVVSGLALQGVHANWFWWNGGLWGMVSVFYFARLWRRSMVLTDAELVELRYPGRAGAVLRAIKAVWFGVFMNLLVIAWVMRAMTKIVTTTMGLQADQVLIWGMTTEVAVVVALFLLTALYTGASGLYGVVATDVLQFALAMVAAIGLAVICWVQIGGRAGLEAGITAHGLDWSSLTSMVPLSDPAPDGSTAKFLVLVGLVWWSSRQLDGGGYLSQRLFAAKNDAHAFGAYLWFTVTLICLRPWPWIIVGLTGVALLGPVADPETYYPLMMVRMLPPGLFGLMLASFLAAFMSTIDTQLNWGASLVVNDLYRRFAAPDATEAHHVLASRVAVLGLAALGGLVSFAIGEIEGAWKLAISVTAGLGTVYAARWYWWRVTAWSELSAMLTAGLCTLAFGVLPPPEWLPAAWMKFPFSAAATGLVVMAVWLAVTAFTSPDPDGPARPHLRAFYERVRPGGRGWARIAGDLPGFAADGPTRVTLFATLAGIATVYGALLGTGGLLLGRPLEGFAGLVAVVVAAPLTVRWIKKEMA